MDAPDPTLELDVVYESPDPVALSIAKAALEEAGIEFTVVEEALTGYGFSPILNPVSRIQVGKSNVAQARKMVEGTIGATAAEPVEDDPRKGDEA